MPSSPMKRLSLQQLATPSAISSPVADLHPATPPQPLILSPVTSPCRFHIFFKCVRSAPTLEGASRRNQCEFTASAGVIQGRRAAVEGEPPQRGAKLAARGGVGEVVQPLKTGDSSAEEETRDEGEKWNRKM
ncbi:tumor suppressor p53-binding protein 1 [Striga asiatica]|uniref:Tumor suppressor p53-binding protein 1 n=1 Tax=Striga asiatica TaxID=4170 RepID=A0A5A7PAD0_STRAF|nr:tumor suppressor p53-binding protein 1 [Striga asiatica]